MSDAFSADPSEGAASRESPSARPSGWMPASRRVGEGSVFAGAYDVGVRLGEGSCGIVHAARRKSDGLQVALKVIHTHLVSDPQVSQRFLREASILGSLQGEHIARMHDCGQDDAGLLYMALELVPGETLGALSAPQRELPLPIVVEILQGILEALGVAHAAGVIHRDLKPDNVMLSIVDGRVEHLRVLDFGLSKLLHRAPGSPNLTDFNMVLGTPEYMAPEQARGEDIDGRCDLYSAGLILYELIAGRPPFQGRSQLAVLTAQLTEVPKAPVVRVSGARVPPSLAAVAMHAIAKQRSDRYPDAASMAEALGRALEAPDDVDSVHPPAVGPDSLPYRDTDRFSAVPRPVTVIVHSRVEPVAVSKGLGIPIYVLAPVIAAVVGVIVGILLAMR